jgi:asparagine synthase (glutamine-hydrolysing)
VRRDLTSLLRYEDRNSMAHSVESRVPFLTTRFAELLFSLPPSYLIDAQGTRKAVFRQAMRGIVPDAVLDRRDKIGFQTPEYAWLGSLKPWVRGILGSDAAARLPVFAAGAIGRITEALDRGTMPSGIPLWRWVNFIRWAELRGVDLA